MASCRGCEAVEDEDGPRGVSARKMLAALLVVLLAGADRRRTFFWLGRRDTAVNGPPELIQAPPGPYKVKPPKPGGLDVAGESETAFETSAGEDKDAQLDLSKVPEQPAPAAKEEPKKLPPNETKAPAEARAARPSRSAGAAGKHDPIGGVRQPGPGRACLDGAVGALPDGPRDEQADRPVPRWNPAARVGRLARRSEAGVPGAEGRRRKLLRGSIGRCRQRFTA